MILLLFPIIKQVLYSILWMFGIFGYLSLLTVYMISITAGIFYGTFSGNKILAAALGIILPFMYFYPNVSGFDVWMTAALCMIASVSAAIKVSDQKEAAVSYTVIGCIFLFLLSRFFGFFN
jgi:vacuolar-type H+-ATPase subunit I/STV1